MSETEWENWSAFTDAQWEEFCAAGTAEFKQYLDRLWHESVTKGLQSMSQPKKPAEFDSDWSETHFEVYNKWPALMRFRTKTADGQDYVGVVGLVDRPIGHMDVMRSRFDRDYDEADPANLIRRIVACLRLHKGESTDELAKKVHHAGILW